MSRYKADLHLHSKYSFDSFMEPRKILKLAKKRGLDLISITDHNSLRGSLDAKRYRKEFDIEVWLGEEVYSDMGDIIGLRISEPIKSRAWEEVIDEIRAQGGIAILPHPFRSHKSVRALAEHCDVVEVFNGRCSIKENAKAKRLAEKLGKPTLGGSDAHVYTEIGKVVNSFDDILQAKKAMDVKMSNSLERTLSYVIRDVKRKKWKNIPRDVAWGLKPR